MTRPCRARTNAYATVKTDRHLESSIKPKSFQALLVPRAFQNINDIVLLVDPDGVKKFSISIARLSLCPLPRKENLASRGGPSVTRDRERFPLPDPRWREIVSARVVLESGTRLTVNDLAEYCGHFQRTIKTPRHFEFLETD